MKKIFTFLTLVLALNTIQFSIAMDTNKYLHQYGPIALKCSGLTALASASFCIANYIDRWVSKTHNPHANAISTASYIAIGAVNGAAAIISGLSIANDIKRLQLPYDMQELIDSCIKKYNISPGTVFSGITKTAKSHIPLREVPVFELAGMTLGLKPVKHSDEEEIASMKSEVFDPTSFERLLQKYQIAIKKYETSLDQSIIMYTPNGKRAALLLIYCDSLGCLSWLNGEPPRNMSYITGHLLGYSPADIEFFTQRNALMDRTRFPEFAQLFRFPAQFADFSPELRKLYERFDKEVWPFSKEKQEFEADKARSLSWIDSLAQCSEAELEARIDQLQAEIIAKKATR